MAKRKAKSAKKTQGNLFGDGPPPAVHKRKKRDTLKGRKVRKELCARKVDAAIGEIEPGCEIYGLTMGHFSLIDILEHVLAATGPADVVISTWTAANADIGFANALFSNGSIKSLRFVVDFSFPSRQPAYCAALREAFGDESIRITKNHAKFVLVRNAKWNVVIRTSMNLNENRRLENFEISDCPAMADFLQGVIDDLFGNQSAAETFGRSPTEHVEAFGSEWGLEDNGASVHFSDSPLGNDLRRAGMTFD